MVLFTVVAIAQSVEEAGAKYNEGNEFYKEKDYASALTAYEAALNIANDAGADADGLKGSIEKQLMNAYYGNAKTQYKAREFDASIASFEKTFALAEQLGDESKQKNSKSYIAKVRTSKGDTFLKKNNIEDAMAEYRMAIEIKPTYYKAYYGFVQVYKVQGDMENMMLNADKVIEYASGNPKTAKYVTKAKSTTSKTLVNAGAKELEKGNGRKAAEFINQSFDYAPGDANAYYYLTLAYNKTSSWDDAIKAANTGIGLEVEDKSNTYFALGQAFEGKGDAEGACNSYKSVTSGPNVDAAKYQIAQVLKCN